jgi:hypothetical protein
VRFTGVSRAGRGCCVCSTTSRGGYFLVMIARSAMMFFCTSVAPAPIEV